VKKQFKNGIKLLPSDKGLISRTYKELKWKRLNSPINKRANALFRWRSINGQWTHGKHAVREIQTTATLRFHLTPARIISSKCKTWVAESLEFYLGTYCLCL
jgi:hypothetical protein